METYKFEFTKQQLEIINQLLMQAPYAVAAPMINSINNQIKSQINIVENNGSN